MNILWFCCFFRQLRRTPKSKHGVDSEPPIEYPRVKENLDPKNYILEDKDIGVFGRAPGEIGGQQFAIRNCKYND
ncbi:hypothetical protein D915_001646 [Fasciola hepatica]|uniref:Uncharacterized protein n=1 Tax=Fasciola hepatica TaxID=6192 RepID=A0A4E0S2A1_FASHE|nr:hypothetical protein D915_001646 [Fasciola hepatica]